MKQKEYTLKEIITDQLMGQAVLHKYKNVTAIALIADENLSGYIMTLIFMKTHLVSFHKAQSVI